ncbi:MAG TPA: TadE/TadG family type IV pilus assembly protein [Terracidiphilus sp.]|nr:TadE/TadG family type IV pilus assembly protein [Terracidiphilus sp.]
MTIQWVKRKLSRVHYGQEGGSLVEMALVSAFIYLPMLFAIFELSFAMYSYTYVSNMARQATRYASVRGTYSCSISSTFPDCDLGPGGGSNPTTATGNAALLAYIQNQAYPGIVWNNVSVNATWITPTVNNPGTGAYSSTTWPAANSCTSTTAGACNAVNNMVQVTVTYAFPLNFPFWPHGTINMTSTSQMMINE